MNVKVIGLGGIGTCLLPVLLRYLNFSFPETNVMLVDGDQFEEKNRHRQAFDQLGNKAEVTVGRSRGEYLRLHVQARSEYVTADNVVQVIRAGDIVFLCVDNHATRKLVSDHCEEVENVVLISGGNELTDGSVHVYIRQDGCNVTLPLANDFHPEIQYPQDTNPGEAGCQEQAESAPQLLLTNNLVAAMMLSSFYATLQNALAYDDLYCDLVTGNCRTQRRRETTCPVSEERS